MAQERVTITGDIKDEPDALEDSNNIFVGTVESTAEPVEERCIVDGRFKDVIKEKGNMLSQTWTELFSLMNQYEAELVNKSGEIDIREAKLKSEENRLNLNTLKTSDPSPVIAVLQQDNVEKDEKIMTYMGEIDSLEKELAELRKELKLKEFHIQTLEKEVSNKDSTICTHEERIQVLEQRVTDITSEVKNKDFIISQVSKQVRSMAPAGRKRPRKGSNPLQSAPAKVARAGESTSTMSLRHATPKQTPSISEKATDDQTSPQDSAEEELDDPKDTDYAFEGGVESVDDEFDNHEPEPSTSDGFTGIKTEPPEEFSFEVSMANYHQEGKLHIQGTPYPVGNVRSLTGSPVLEPVESKKTATFLYHKVRKAERNSSPTMLPLDEPVLDSNITPAKCNVPSQQYVTSTGVHILGRLPPTKRRKYSQKRCRVCYRQGKRRETTTYCPTCPSNPGLCAGACFEMFHSLSPADYDFKPSQSMFTACDEAKSMALSLESSALLDEVIGSKTDGLESVFVEHTSAEVNSFSVKAKSVEPAFHESSMTKNDSLYVVDTT